MVQRTGLETCFMYMATIFLLSTAVLIIPLKTTAAQKLVSVEGASYSVSVSLADNLKTFIGKTVSLTLKSGTVITGIVKEVGDHLVHLEKLDRKEYFDALIRLDEISAMDTRFRQPQR